MLAVIPLVPILCYGAIAAGSFLASWLIEREPKKKDDKSEKKKDKVDKKIETTDDILSQDLMIPREKEHDNYHGDDRFELLDL